MKCFNCGNLIPDSSVLCPYCNTKLTNSDVGITNPIKEGDTSIIPITPTEAVLPQDKLEGTQIITGTNQGFIQPNTGDSKNMPQQVFVNRDSRVSIDLSKPVNFDGQQAETKEAIDARLMQAYGSALVEAPTTRAVNELNNPVVYDEESAMVAPVQPGTPVTPVVPLAPVQPVAPVAPVIPEQPVAPVQPVVPVAPVQPTAPVAEPVVATPLVPEQPVQPVAPVQSVAPVAPVVPEPPVAPVAPVAPEIPVQPTAPVVDIQPTAPANGEFEYAPTPASSGIEPPAEEPKTEEEGFNYGMQIGRTAPVIKKKNVKGTLIKLFIAIIVICILGGGGYFVYSTLYMSGDKKIAVASNKLLDAIDSIRATALEKKSGTFTFVLDISANDKKYGFDMEGKYGYDLTRRIYTANTTVKSLKYESELLDDNVGDLKTTFYKFKRENYIQLHNFFNQFIYTTSETDEPFVGVAQNSINYNAFVKGFSNAIKSGIANSKYTQSVEKDTIGGNSKTYNVVTIDLSKKGKEKILNSIKSRLLTNTDFLTQIANMRSVKADTVKDEISSYFDSIEVTDNKESVKIYTDLFGNTFYGIKYVGTFDDVKYVLELVPTGNNSYSISIKKGDKDFIKGTYSRKNTRDSENVTITYDLDIVVNVDKVAYNVSADLQIQDAIKPSVDKIITKDSIAQEYLTQEEVNKITDALDNYGTFGIKRTQVIEAFTKDLDALPFNKLGTRIFNYLNKYITVGDLVAIKEDNQNQEPEQNTNTKTQTPTN